MDLYEAAQTIRNFEQNSLGKKLSHLESQIIGIQKSNIRHFCETNALNPSLLEAASDLKKLAGQINVIIHAAGILCALPHILEEGEKIEYVSLGAGNTGRKFDLETNLRIAEFKFINWRGGPESIRQNTLFKDFYYLAHEETTKKKFMYVLGLEQPLKFFNGGRNLNSVLSKNHRFREQFFDRHQDSYAVVKDYYQAQAGCVEIVDLSKFLPQLMQVISLTSDGNN